MLDNKMKGYKIFGPDYTDWGYKYSLDKPNVYTGSIDWCKTGFYFYIYARDCKRYEINDTNTYAIVESGDNYVVKQDKVLCDQITIVKTLTKDEFLHHVNNGEYKRWHKKMKLREDMTYVNGKRHGDYKMWHENGQLLIETTYTNGEEDGPYKEWYRDGQLCIETTLVHGKQHGSYKHWYENGQLWEETTYVHGKRHGSYKSWFEDGKMYTETTYDNGEMMYPI